MNKVFSRKLKNVRDCSQLENSKTFNSPLESTNQPARWSDIQSATRYRRSSESSVFQRINRVDSKSQSCPSRLSRAIRNSERVLVSTL